MEDAITRLAREHVQAILGLISLVLWFILAFGLVVVLDLAHPETQVQIMMVGGIALVISALPWLAYPALVRRERGRLQRRTA